MKMYRVLVADPPWSFGDSLPGQTRGAVKNYDLMSVDDICNFTLPPMYETSVLFLWRVASMQQEALNVIDAWGYDLKAELVWRKITSQGKRWFGMGRQVRNEHEVCLIATSGRAKPLNNSTRSMFDAKVGRHSEKPEEFYQIVEQMYEGPRAELFARKHRNGWDCFGKEL